MAGESNRSAVSDAGTAGESDLWSMPVSFTRRTPASVNNPPPRRVAGEVTRTHHPSRRAG